MIAGQFDFIGQDAYLFSIGCVKVSILLMYLRTFTGNKPFKYTVWVLISLVIGVHSVAFLGWTFSTYPIWCHWTYWPTDEEYAARCHHPAIEKINVPYSLFLNTFTVVMDLIILYLPCRPVWRLQLAKRQRISILVILFAGVVYELAHPPSNDKPSSLQSDQRYHRQHSTSWILCRSILPRYGRLISDQLPSQLV